MPLPPAEMCVSGRASPRLWELLSVVSPGDPRYLRRAVVEVAFLVLVSAKKKKTLGPNETPVLV